jgi:hypothetical protein
MTYSLYYVSVSRLRLLSYYITDRRGRHDGAMSEGHRHDWESATVTWTSKGGDLWDRSVILIKALLWTKLTLH